MGIRFHLSLVCLAVLLSLFLVGGSCLESPSAMMVGLAEGQAGRGENDKAIASFNRAVEMSPNSWYVYIHRGEFYLKMNRFSEAASDLSRVIALYPELHNIEKVYSERGDALRSLGRYDEAVLDYTTAVNIKNDYAPAFYGRGLAHLVMGKTKQALADMEAACLLGEPRGCGVFESIAPDTP
jgi:tetratricopeptide (TPR) repeat protein